MVQQFSAVDINILSRTLKLSRIQFPLSTDQVIILDTSFFDSRRAWGAENPFISLSFSFWYRMRNDFLRWKSAACLLLLLLLFLELVFAKVFEDRVSPFVELTSYIFIVFEISNSTNVGEKLGGGEKKVYNKNDDNEKIF